MQVLLSRSVQALRNIRFWNKAFAEQHRSCFFAGLTCGNGWAPGVMSAWAGADAQPRGQGWGSQRSRWFRLGLGFCGIHTVALQV